MPTQDDLPGFLSADRRAEKLLEYLQKVATHLRAEQEQIAGEVGRMTEKVDNVKEVIAAQQNYARAVSFREDIDLEKLLNDVLAMHAPSFSRHSIQVETDFEPLPPVHVEKNKVVQVVDNLVRNAVESMRDAAGEVCRLTLSLCEREENQARIVVADTGGGIKADQLEQIFNYGFTTKRGGNGFGLHSAALAVNSLGGKITASSEGSGRGANFTLDLPIRPEKAEPQESQPRSQKRLLMLQNEEAL